MLQKTADCVNSDVNSNVVPFRPVADGSHECERGVVVKADLDDGYLRLSNTLVDALCQTKLSDRESRVLFAVIRRTYGFGKAIDWISYSQIEEMTGIDSDNVSRVAGILLRRHILIKQGKKIGVNTVISAWLDKPVITKAASLGSITKLSKQTVKPVNLNNSTVSLDSKTCQSRPPQNKDNTTKERQKDICAKSSFNDFFKAYPIHRKGGSDSAAWTAWKSEKLTDQDCKTAIEWLAQAAQRDPSWGVNASGQFVLGVTKFIRTKTWLTPLPQAVNRQANHLHTPAHSVDHNPYADFANDFNTEL
jgi:phage replication O-like protein O